MCFKNIKKLKVYDYNMREPWGTVRDLCFENDSQSIKAIVVETISLIPISCLVEFKDIKNIGMRGIILKKDCRTKKISCLEDFTSIKSISSVRNDKNKKSIFRDMRFNLETGEITDIVLAKNIFSKKTKIPINKITIKENTIYIENNEK